MYSPMKFLLFSGGGVKYLTSSPFNEKGKGLFFLSDLGIILVSPKSHRGQPPLFLHFFWEFCSSFLLLVGDMVVGLGRGWDGMGL